MAKIELDLGEIVKLVQPFIAESRMNIASRSGGGLILAVGEDKEISLTSLECRGEAKFKGVNFEYVASLAEERLELRLT